MQDAPAVGIHYIVVPVAGGGVLVAFLGENPGVGPAPNQGAVRVYTLFYFHAFVGLVKN